MNRTIATLASARCALQAQADPEKARILSRFFKAGAGEYGEGDVFLGVTVPRSRAVAKAHRNLPVADLRVLLDSSVHEERFLALVIMVERYKRGDEAERERLFKLYLRKKKRVNNWDLVDTSAEHIVGAHLWERDKSLLFRLARSRSVWDRRIAVLSTFHFIRKGRFEETLRLAEALLGDRHDLIHKAVGWMLREIGERDRAAEEAFLAKHARRMPWTMLRYAIEKLPPARRKSYMARA